MSRVLTPNAISQHNKVDDLYLVIKGNVYDVTRFHKEHPGGPEFLLDQGGTDVSELFENAGHSAEARALLKDFHIGTISKKANNPRASKSSLPLPHEVSPAFGYWALVLPLLVILLGTFVLACSRDLFNYLDLWGFS